MQTGRPPRAGSASLAGFSSRDADPRQRTGGRRKVVCPGSSRKGWGEGSGVCEPKWVALSLASTLSRAGRRRTGEAQEWAEEGRWVTGEKLKESHRLGLSSQQWAPCLRILRWGRSSGRRGSGHAREEAGRGSWRCSASPPEHPPGPAHPSSGAPVLLPVQTASPVSPRFFSGGSGKSVQPRVSVAPDLS